MNIRKRALSGFLAAALLFLTAATALTLPAGAVTQGDIQAIRDRLDYDSASRCFVVVCGSDDLARIQVDSAPAPGGGLSLAGALVYEAEDQILARFQAELQPRDNMFGYAITAMDVS